MKPFLGIDVTNDKKNEKANGSEFLVQTPSAALTNSLETSIGKAEETIDRSKLPLVFRIIQYLCTFAALMIAVGILKADVSIAQGYQNAPALFWACGICAVIGCGLWIWSRLKSKAILETEESNQAFSHLVGVSDAIYKELGVPEEAKDVDLLSFFYKVNDGEIKVHEKGLQLAQYFNPEYKVFTDEKNIYFANLEGKYAIPLESVVKIHTIKKHIRIECWNKEEPHNKGFYKQFKLSTDDNGCINCKSYHILEFSQNGETWGIYFPGYELQIFEELNK